MLLARDNLSLVTAADEEVTLRLTHYLVPAAFGLIFTLGLLGNFMVIGVVRMLCIQSQDFEFRCSSCGFWFHYPLISISTGLPQPPDSEHDKPADPEPGGC